MASIPTTATRQRKETRALGGGTTARLGGGPTARRSGRGGTTRRITNTLGGTTSHSRKDQDEDMEFDDHAQAWFNVKPHPLFVIRSKPAEEGKGDAPDESRPKDEQLGDELKDGEESKDPKAKDKDKPNMSMTSQGLNSSLMESSDDDAAKAKKAADKASKKTAKGLTTKELDMNVDVELSETSTTILFSIPGITGVHETEEYNLITEENAKYETLLVNKKGSDSYEGRGAQTMNHAMKSREINCTDLHTFVEHPVWVQATNYDIDDSAKQEAVSAAQKMTTEFYNSIQKTMDERMKDPRCLIDAESLASHVSIISASAETKGVGGGETTLTKKKKKKGDQQSSAKESGTNSQKERSSATGLKQSESESATEKISQTSQSQTGAGGGSSDTMFKSGKVEYVTVELPDTMLQAIRIIERLLTQAQFHEQHVLYKAYPSVKLESKLSADDEEEEEGGAKKMKMGMRKQDKKKEQQEEQKVEEEEIKEGQVIIKPLFTFERADLTAGRQITCIDINSANPDLICVAYGEYDINCTHENQLKPGLLCFWTLKNPKNPELFIKTDYSITCCSFAKKKKNWVAIGDSHGNIAIYNVQQCVQTGECIPVAESKESVENKHNDIVWEVQWVLRESGEERLISVSGDGRIIEWSLRKGLELTELYQLKRETNPNHKDVYAGADVEKKSGAMSFINTGGLSIDFPDDNQGINYFTATEDCTILQCQVSYSEQWMQMFHGHTGPVYKVRCNPFWHEMDNPIFATCSYDWTVRIWSTKQQTEKLVCRSTESDDCLREQVNDICWSPKTSSVFSSVANDGRVEIWDLKTNNLAPVVCYFDKDEAGNKIHIPKTAVKFARALPVLLTGDTEGKVHVYRTTGLEHIQVTKAEQIRRLQSALSKDDFAETKTDKKEGEESAAE